MYRKNDFNITPVQRNQYNKSIPENLVDQVVLDLEHMLMMMLMKNAE